MNPESNAEQEEREEKILMSLEYRLREAILAIVPGPKQFHKLKCQKTPSGRIRIEIVLLTEIDLEQ